MSAWNAPAPPYNAPSTTYMNTFTPYLQLKHLLSLTWLAYPVLSLLIVAFRLQLSLATSQDAVTGAKNDLLASCKAAETAATTAASMPRYLAIASNQQFSDAVNGSLNAARAALILALTVMEAIINFIVDLYRSTFLCFLELVVRGGLAILISAVQEINSLVQSAAASLRTSIQSDISSANSAITTAINAINKINPFSDIQAPQISVPSLDSLQNLTLPDSFTQALTNLNNSIPSVADLKDVVESIIDTPFELVKKDINDTFSQFSFDSSVLPIPDQNRLSFCNQLDTSLVDDVGRDLIKTTKIGIIIMILLALLLIGLNCLLTWYKWRCMKAHFEYTRQAWATDPTITHTVTIGTPQVTLTDHNLMLLQSNSAHPLITRIVNQVAARFRLTPSQYTNLQWFLSYIFHAPAVACLLIGFFGLLSIQIQLLAMGPLVAKYQDRAQAASSDFSNSIAASINSSMYNQSAAYASNINGQVDAVQTQINNGVFGWIENTTQTLNNTVNAFYDDVQNAVATVFNGSILEEPANEFIKCFIGSKVDAIESALTFLHDNLQIDIPRVNDSVLVLSPASVNEATAPIAAAALGDGSDGNQGILLRLVNGYAESLKRERILFALFLGLWGFVVLMAICILMFHSFKERKRIRYLNESRTRHDEIVVPYKIGMQNSEEKGVGQMGSRNLPAFTPLPSPKFNAFKPFSFSRSPSPASTSSNDPSQSKESLPQKPESSWASLFTRNHNAEGKDPSPLAKGPTRLFAIGRKAIGKDRVKTTVEEQTNQDTSSPAEPQQNENRNTAWFKRMTNVISKKDSVPDFWENNAGRGRPNLQISIEPPSRDSIDADDSVAVDNREDEDPKSRWSASPDPTQNASPWANMITPVKKPFSPPRQPISLPMRPKPRHNASVPTSISIDTDPVPDLMVPMQPTPFARPLHHGFDSTQHALYRPPPPPSHPRPPRPLRSPRRASLAPPPDRHRRSSTVPEWTIPQTLQVPVSRFLTGQTSPINPFVTPFDDERHVTIDPPAHARKSMRTNPFAPVAL